jgi:tetratricopeptide (TPR) repeat protein
MELTIEQALHQGIAAHKKGKLEEAERLYGIVLKPQPLHPDANHNLGVLAVSVNKADIALPLFKTALESNPNIEQFWISYIDVLISLNMGNEAKLAIQACKDVGHNSEKIKSLSAKLEPKNLKLSTVFSVEDFYQKITTRMLTKAARGWLFADSFERHFMEDTPLSVMAKKEVYLSKNYTFPSKNQLNLLQLNSSQILQKLNNEQSILKKYNYLKDLISSDDVNLVNDSFKADRYCDLENAIGKTFDSESLNIAVIGGGVCGLFIANSLKHCFGDRANVLVLDNRSRCPNTRERFKRDWLTHIPTGFFKSSQPSNIQFLIEDFGSNGLIGIPINILETILQISCKDQGVKFYFSEMLDYSTLNNDVIDLVFDATGGRLMEYVYSASNATELSVKIPKADINLKYAGVKQLHNTPGVGTEYLDVVLKPCGDFHCPYIGNTKICVHMCKITGVPIHLMETILESVERVNSLNLFYVWKGCLNDEINEGLIILNLFGKECDFLTSRIKAPIKLKYFLISEPNISDHLNENIMSIIEMLALMDVDAQISIESPFKYSPYANLNSTSGSLHGKRVFPVGDSLFCGHPKMGNGLHSHLPFINELIEKMVNH